MGCRVKVLGAVAVLLAAAVSQAEVVVSFDYSTDTTGFFSPGSAARATLEAAGSFYEGILEDDLLEIAPGGGNTWSAIFRDPTSDVDDYRQNLVVPADTLIVFVGARELGAGALGVGGPGGWAPSGTQAWLDLVLSRGEGAGTIGSVIGATANEFGPWGGALWLDSDSNWNLDHTTAPVGAEADLYSVVFHELAHLLGFGLSDSWNNLVVGGQFTGAESVAEYGGNVPLSSGHWAQGTQSNVYPGGVGQETVMTPLITLGTRKVMTDLDVAGLADVGWEIAPVPEPSSVVLLSSAAIVFFAAGARRRRKSKS